MSDTTATVFALAQDDSGNDTVYRVRILKDVRDRVVEIFNSGVSPLFDEAATRIEFSGNYQPEEDEVLFIPEFPIPNSISGAIADPAGVADLKLTKEKTPPIRALFVDIGSVSQPKVAFQLFRKNQFLTRRGISIIVSQSTFKELTDPGLVISYDVTACFEGGNLLFRSFHAARQIFELSGYYREATNADISELISNENFVVEDKQKFYEVADAVIRKRIASLLDGDAFTKIKPKELVQLSSGFDDVQIKLDDKDRIVLPGDRKSLKSLLKFLDDEYYFGPVSAQRYVASSKRRIN